jgi:hypothetical protein
MYDTAVYEFQFLKWFNSLLAALKPSEAVLAEATNCLAAD